MLVLHLEHSMWHMYTRAKWVFRALSIHYLLTFDCRTWSWRSTWQLCLSLVISGILWLSSSVPLLSTCLLLPVLFEHFADVRSRSPGHFRCWRRARRLYVRSRSPGLRHCWQRYQHRTHSKQHGCQFASKYWPTLAGKFSYRSLRRLLYSLSLWLHNADNAAARWLSDKFIFDVVTSRSIAHSTWNRHRSNNTWGSCWSLSAMSLYVITVLMSVQRGFLALNCLNNSWSMPWSRRFQPLHSHHCIVLFVYLFYSSYNSLCLHSSNTVTGTCLQRGVIWVTLLGEWLRFHIRQGTFWNCAVWLAGSYDVEASLGESSSGCYMHMHDWLAVVVPHVLLVQTSTCVQSHTAIQFKAWHPTVPHFSNNPTLHSTAVDPKTPVSELLQCVDY